MPLLLIRPLPHSLQDVLWKDIVNALQAMLIVPLRSGLLLINDDFPDLRLVQMAVFRHAQEFINTPIGSKLLGDVLCRNISQCLDSMNRQQVLLDLLEIFKILWRQPLIQQIIFAVIDDAL